MGGRQIDREDKLAWDINISGQNNVARQGCSALAQTGKQTIGPFNWLSPLVCDSHATLLFLVTVYLGIQVVLAPSMTIVISAILCN